MFKTRNRVRVIQTINKYGLRLELLKEHGPDDILLLCDKLGERKTPLLWYAGDLDIQKELISDDRFFFYLEKMDKAGFAKPMAGTFLKELHKKGDTAVSYPIDRLLSSMALTAHRSNVFYDYLKHISARPSCKAQKEAAIQNLNRYDRLACKPIAELTEAEQLLFLEPCLEEPLSEANGVERVLSMLASPTGPLNILRFLQENSYGYRPSVSAYESMNLAAQDIYEKLRLLHKMLDRTYMISLLRLWFENNCPLYDLEILAVKLKGMDDEKLQENLSTRSSYINLIYGGKINGIPLTEIPSSKEDILIYAITAKKNGFLRLAEKNYEEFSLIPSDSILFSREFYTRYLNLNTLNMKNLRDCRSMRTREMELDALEPGRLYTFDEIKALYDRPIQYIKLYARLSGLRLDERLIVFKQLTKNNLLAAITEEESINRLADRLIQKPLSHWRDQDFRHIKGLDAHDIAELLIYHTEIEKMIPQMKTRTDARLVLRARESLQNYASITEMKGDLMRVDHAWKALLLKMDFSAEFLERHNERVIEFLCQNGADIVKTYYNNLSSEQRRESFRRVVVAMLMGEFRTLKYHGDDLRREIDFPIQNSQSVVWMENSGLSTGSFAVDEYDDFFSTMMLGLTPYRTCLSYIDGQYSECLLANFDSNKKVLYAKKDGKIVGRALIRLTKGRFLSNGKQQESDSISSLSFVDLESEDPAANEKESALLKERIVIFLERSYSSNISEETHQQIKRIFIELMEQKASQMGAMLVLSNQYSDSLRDGYTLTNFHMYISRSKAGAQYLDSLNGQASVSDEGGYRVNSFYIRSADVV